MDFGSLKGVFAGISPWIILIGGAALGWVKSFWELLYDHTVGFAVDRIKVSITIEESDHKEAFIWLSMWMEKHLRKRKINSIRLQRKEARDDRSDDLINEYELVPGYGFYYIFWHGRLLTFDSTKKDITTANTGRVSPLLRTINLTIWGTRDRNLIFEVLEEARKEFEVIKNKRLKYYTQCSDWWNDHDMVNRSLDTIYLPDEQLQNILEDFQTFFDSEDKYKKLGVPWRRTYLFEGPAGSGKSSFVQALATYFKMPVYYMNLHEKLDASGLQGLLSSVVPPCIVLVEDIDSVNAARERVDEKSDEDKKESSLKTSDLLNALDGLIATEKRIVIMTTNHPDKLDRALLRKGRTDRIVHIGYAKEPEIRKFYERAKEYYDLPEFPEFRKVLPENCTIADAQAYLFEPKFGEEDLTIFKESDTLESEAENGRHY